MKGAEQVRVFLKGRQVDAAGEESRITLSVIGRRFLRGESRYVSYDDAELIEGAIVPTILRIGADDVRRRPLYAELRPGAGTARRLPHAVRAVLAVHADATPACAQLPGRGGGSVYFLYALCGRDASERQHDGNTN